MSANLASVATLSHPAPVAPVVQPAATPNLPPVAANIMNQTQSKPKKEEKEANPLAGLFGVGKAQTKSLHGGS